MATNCTDLEAEWAARLGSELPPDAGWSAAAEAHFASCADCRRRRATEACLDEAISAWRKSPQPVVDLDALTERLLADAGSWQPSTAAPAWQPQLPSRLPPVRVFAAVLATAALVLIAVLVWQPADPTEIVLTPPAVPAAAGLPGEVPGPDTGRDVDEVALAASPVTETVAALWHDVRAQSSAVAHNTVASLDRLPTVHVSPNIEVSLSNSEEFNTESPTSGNDRPATWLDWSRPLGQQVGGAFRFLGDALPGDTSPAT